MDKRMKLNALALLALMTVASAQTNTKTGTSTAQFLKIGVHARSLGMGDASVGSVSDIAAIYSNPAGLSRYGVQEVVFSQMDWFAGIKLFHFAGGLNLGNAGTIAMQITTLDYGDEAVRTIDKQDGTGEFYSALDLSVGVAYARNLTKSFSFGAQFKYLNSRIWHMSANAVAVDVGALFLTPFKGVRLGMAITNFGTKMKLEGRNIRFFADPDEIMTGNNSQIPAVYELSRWPLPLTFRVGLSGELIQAANLRLSWAVDALHPSDNSEFIDMGTELALSNRLFLRAGLHNLFMVDQQQGRMALGAGLHHAFSPTLKVNVDYAWVDYALLLPVSMLSFTIEY